MSRLTIAHRSKSPPGISRTSMRRRMIEKVRRGQSNGTCDVHAQASILIFKAGMSRDQCAVPGGLRRRNAIAARVMDLALRGLLSRAPLCHCVLTDAAVACLL